MRYALMALTLMAAMAFAVSVAIEAGWLGNSSTSPVSVLTSKPESASTPRPLPQATKVIAAYYFAGPNDVQRDALNRIFVADTFNNRVVQLGPRDTQFPSWGHHATRPAKMKQPERVAAVRDGFFVIDANNSRIQKFSFNGTLIHRWSADGSLGTMIGPTGIAVDAHGHVYLADGNNDRVLRLSPDGRVAASWTTKGFLPGAQGGPDDPGFPGGIAVDGSGQVYVAYPNARAVQKFSAHGAPIAIWRLPQAEAQISDVAVDTGGDIYVTDLAQGTVSKLSSTGSLLATWGRKGHARGQFSHPDGLTVDSHGHIYVADTGNNRVQELSSTGKVMHVWVYG